MNKKKMLFVLAGILVIVVLVYAYREYHRTNANVHDAKAVYDMDAVALIGEFDRDDSVALRKYVGKIILVRGAVKGIEKDEHNDYTLFLGDSAHSSSLRCSMDSVYTSGLQDYTIGKWVAIKGILVGVDADATGLLGSDIAMNRCLAMR